MLIEAFAPQERNAKINEVYKACYCGRFFRRTTVTCDDKYQLYLPGFVTNISKSDIMTILDPRFVSKLSPEKKRKKKTLQIWR